MRRLAKAIFFLGFILILGAALMAFETSMTEDKRTASRDSINTWLDEKNEEYEQAREDGCRRRCGGLGSLSRVIISFRDGIFLSLPFDAKTTLPDAPAGWQKSDYSLSKAEVFLDHKLVRSLLSATTEDRILTQLERIVEKPKAGAIAFYTQGEKTILLAIKVSRTGIRDAMNEKKHKYKSGLEPYAEMDGLTLFKRPQVSHNWRTDTDTPVDYQRFLLDLHGQVEIRVIANAPHEDIRAFLSTLDLPTIVKNLPYIPTRYTPGTGVFLDAKYSQSEE